MDDIESGTTFTTSTRATRHTSNIAINLCTRAYPHQQDSYNGLQAQVPHGTFLTKHWQMLGFLKTRRVVNTQPNWDIHAHLSLRSPKLRACLLLSEGFRPAQNRRNTSGDVKWHGKGRFASIIPRISKVGITYISIGNPATLPAPQPPNTLTRGITSSTNPFAVATMIAASLTLTEETLTIPPIMLKPT